MRPIEERPPDLADQNPGWGPGKRRGEPRDIVASESDPVDPATVASEFDLVDPGTVTGEVGT